MKLDKYEIGKRYGKAIFQLSVDKECVDQVYDELTIIRQIFKENPDLGKMMDAVHVNIELKEKLFNELTTPFSPLVQHAIAIIYQYHRMAYMVNIIDSFEHLYDEKNKHLRGIVKSVIPLSDEQREKIEQQVAHILGYQSATLSNQLDPSIIGGFVVEANHYVIDRSLQQKIRRIARTLNIQ